MARIIHAPQVEPRRKPPRGARVNWANPITREMTFLAPLWEGGGGVVQDVVSQRDGTLQGSVGWGVSETGVAAQFTKGGNDAIDFGDIERHTGSWSVMGIIRTPASLGTGGQILVARANGASGGYQQNYVLMAEYGRSPKVFSIGTSANSYIRAYSLVAVQPLTEYVVIGTFNATTYQYRIAVNGIVEATATGSALPSTSSQRLTLGAGDGSDYAFNLDAQLAMAAVWDRALSDGEIARLGAEPFSLLTFGRRVLPSEDGPAPQSYAGAMTPAGTLGIELQTSLAGSISSAGVTDLQIEAVMVGLVGSAGALDSLTTFGQDVDGGVTPAGTLGMESQVELSGSLTPAGDAGILVEIAAAAASTPAGEIASVPQLILSSSNTPTGILSHVHSFLSSLVAGSTPAGTLGISVQAAINGVISSAGTVATILSSGFVGVVGTVSSAGSLAWRLSSSIVAGIAPAGSLISRLGVFLSGGAASSGTVTALLAALRKIMSVRGMAGNMRVRGLADRRTVRGFVDNLRVRGKD